jgi:hypothetical protein
MKKHFLLLMVIFFVFVSTISAQTKIEKYCQVIVAPKTKWTSDRIARISFGENKWLFSPRDTTVFQQLHYVNSLTTETDVLNYMSKIGWTLVDVHPENLFQTVFYFKKIFDVSEFMADYISGN